MRKLGWFHKILWFVNVVVVLITLLLYGLQYVYIKGVAVLSFTMPLLLLFNGFFVLYWMVYRRKLMLLSLVVLFFGYRPLTNSFGFFGNSDINAESEQVKLMTYNVRALNRQGWIDKDSVDYKILDFVKKEAPDIICFQEFTRFKASLFNDFPFRYLKYVDKWKANGQAIYSNYEIINQGSLDFKNTANNAIFADVVVKSDTLRIYSVHLQSFYIQPEQETISADNSDRLLRRVARVMEIQKGQAEMVVNHMKQSPYRNVVMGDFNTTQYTAIYNILATGMHDTFRERGSGFGKTFYFKYFPFRIDHILVDPQLEVVAHENYDVFYSDHYPVSATLAIGAEK